jgi:hypothetical protein
MVELRTKSRNRERGHDSHIFDILACDQEDV